MTEDDSTFNYIRELQEYNDLLFAGLAACVMSTGKKELFIPDIVLDKKYHVEINRDKERYGFVVKVSQPDSAP